METGCVEPVWTFEFAVAAERWAPNGEDERKSPIPGGRGVSKRLAQSSSRDKPCCGSDMVRAGAGVLAFTLAGENEPGGGRIK